MAPAASIEVLERGFEEQRLARLFLFDLPANCSVVVVAIPDGAIEDRRIRGEVRYREPLDLTGEPPALLLQRLYFRQTALVARSAAEVSG